MALISHRVLVPLTVVVVAWAGAHLLSGRSSAAISPAVWPISAPAPSSTAAPTRPSASAPMTTASPPGAADSVPILPGAMEQLNSQTGATAIGVYALLQQLEGALSSRLEQLAHQLEPFR